MIWHLKSWSNKVVTSQAKRHWAHFENRAQNLVQEDVGFDLRSSAPSDNI